MKFRYLIAQCIVFLLLGSAAVFSSCSSSPPPDGFFRVTIDNQSSTNLDIYEGDMETPDNPIDYDTFEKIGSVASGGKAVLERPIGEYTYAFPEAEQSLASGSLFELPVVSSGEEIEVSLP